MIGRNNMLLPHKSYWTIDHNSSILIVPYIVPALYKSGSDVKESVSSNEILFIKVISPNLLLKIFI